MKPLLFLIQPYDMVAGARVDVRVASVPSPVYAGMSGYVWEGAVSRRPRFMQDLMSPQLDGKTMTARGDFMLNLGQIKNVAQPTSLNWNGAPVTVWDATSMDPANLPVEFKGTISNQTLDVWTSQLIINLEVDIGRLDRPLLSGEFTGGGGLLGDADKRGTPWPAGFGFCENCEPVWFDAVNNVGMLDGYGNLTSIAGLYEGGASLGASFGDYASYALLVAAAIPPGRWGTCLTAGLIRLGAPPAGRISADATFRGAAGTGANRAGAMIRRILETQASIATADLDTVSLAALDAAVPRNIHYWTSTQRSCQDLCEKIAAGANASLIVLLNGLISVTRAFGGANIGTVNRTSTSAPAVTDWQLAAPEEPVWRMRARTGRPGTVFQFSDIMYEDNLIDMGVFAIGTTYRQGNLVWLADGSQWLWINALPGVGHTPPASPATSDAYWQRTKPPTTAADLVYGDGTTIESLKPAAPGATRNIIYRQTTDPVLAVTVFNGDIWVDTSNGASGPDVTKVRTAGAWQISATPNFVTYSASAPVSPANGDIWVDTSVTPNVARVRVAGVWQASSNLVTQGTDIGVSNGAGTTVTVVPVAASIQAVGNSVRRISGGGSWDAGFNTADARTAGAFLQFTNVGVGNIYMVGLTDTPITNAINNYTQITYAPYINGTALDAMVNGVSRGLSATIAAGDVVSVAYDNISIRLYKTTVAGATTLLDTFATTAGRRFLCCGTVLNLTAANTFASIGIRFESTTNQNWGDVQGANRPADNATADIVLTAFGSQAGTLIGNSFVRNAGGADYNSAVRSPLMNGACLMEMDIQLGASVWTIISLDTNATNNTPAAQTIYVQYQASSGAILFEMGGAVVYNTTIATNIAGKIQIFYDKVRFRVLLGGTQYGGDFAAASPSYQLYAKWFSYTAAATLTGLRAGATPASNLWVDVGGAHVPAPDATADLVLTSIGATAPAIVGNTILKSAAGSNYDSIVRGVPVTGPQFVEMDIAAGSFFTVISLDGSATDNTEAALDFIGYYNSASGVWGLETVGGVLAYSGVASAGAVGKIRLIYDGIRFRFYLNQFQLGSDILASATNLVLYPKWIAYNSGVTYTGLRSGLYTANFWSDMGGAGRPSDNATADMSFATGSYSTATHTFVGNTITKVGGVANWDGFAASKQSSIGHGRVTFLLPVYAMAGLTTTPQGYSGGALAQYGGLNFCVYNANFGGWYIFEGGANILSMGTSYLGVTFSAATVWQIDYDGLTVKYYADNVLVRTSTASPSLQVYFGVTIINAGDSVKQVTLDTLTDRYLDNMGDGATYARLPVANSVGTGTARRALIDLSQGHTGKNLDNIADSGTYARILTTELTSGAHKLTIAGSGKKLGDARQLPNVQSVNLGSKSTGTVSYSAAAGTPATATISVTAGNVVTGSVSTAYNAMSANVTGTGGTTVTYYLYANDPANAGGAQTLIATTTALNVYSGDGYVYFGFVDVFFPSSGSGSGGGSGGGSQCVWDEAWVETDQGSVRAANIRAGDRLRVLNDDRTGFALEPVESVDYSNEDCSQITAENGFRVTVSNSTPITLQDGRVVSVADIPNNRIPVDDAGLRWVHAAIIPAGVRRVVHIRCGQKTYGAGDLAGQPIFTHNPKP